MSLHVTKDQRAELLGFLEEVYLRGGSELRVDLPGNWILFWKTRESESRLLLAHPQHDEWVATLALEAEHGRRVLDAVRALQMGDVVSLSEQGAIGSISNVEVIVGLCNES